MTASSSRVLLLYGGVSADGDTSIASARRVLEGLRAAALPITPVRWGSDGWVVLPEGEDQLHLAGMGRSPVDVLNDIRSAGFGVVFNCMHGGLGADGTAQGLFDLAGVPYTGAGVHGSAVASRLHLWRACAQAMGCETPPAAIVHRDAWSARAREMLTTLVTEVGLPAVVRGTSGGGLQAPRRAADASQLEECVTSRLLVERSVVVERGYSGRDLWVPVIGTRAGSSPQVLPVFEMETPAEDADSRIGRGRKPSRGAAPAALEPEVLQFIAERALLVHRELDLGGATLTNVLIGPDGPLFLASTTLPPLAEGEIFSECATAAGLEFPALCRRFIDYALSAHLARGATPLHDSSPGHG